MSEKIWKGGRGGLFLEYRSPQQEKLENAIYQVRVTPVGQFYLEYVDAEFTFDYKLYGLEKKLISRIKRTRAHTQGNLGMIFNGLKGTGKSVTSKQICNILKNPVILLDNCEHIEWVNTIPQEITIFIDEYEKVFKESDQILSIMDGAFESEHRRIFILTTNKLYINENLIHRPGRVRYLKTFKDLTPEVVEEIVDDCLDNKKLKADVIIFCSSLENITIDVVKSICQECNIHDEPPQDFQDVFNVRKVSGKHDVMLIENEEEFRVAKGVKVWPRDLEDAEVGAWFQYEGNYTGIIKSVINYDTFVLEIKCKSDEVEHNPFLQRMVSEGIDIHKYSEKGSPGSPGAEGVDGLFLLPKIKQANLIFTLADTTQDSKPKPKSKRQPKAKVEELTFTFTLRVRESFMMNKTYRYNNGTTYGANYDY
jgi:hypothetical protein